MKNDDRYGSDSIERFIAAKRNTQRPEVPATAGLVVEHTLTEFVGEVTAVRSGGVVEVRDFDGFSRTFPLSDGFRVDEQSVTLTAPKATSQGHRVTASGSYAAPSSRARVARASRIFVEGLHDAELIELVWGDDLRHEGVVVEVLEGVDHLREVIEAFDPGPERRAGVLVDHLVEGSKESRIAEDIHRSFGTHVRVLGHPFVDIWQAVKPERIGVRAWPAPPRSVEWKRGVCEALGWPHAEQADIAEAWKRIRSRVRDYRDLEPALSSQVEHLIDFVTVG